LKKQELTNKNINNLLRQDEAEVIKGQMNLTNLQLEPKREEVKMELMQNPPANINHKNQYAIYDQRFEQNKGSNKNN